jgi:spore photoproduct lyase
MTITRDIRQSLKIRSISGSSDYVSPGFGWGCLYNCSYCFIKRYKPKGLSISKNINQILTEIYNHSIFASTETKKPNNTHSTYITYDIGHSEDFAHHAEHHEWKRIFDFFKNNDKIMGTFSTKYVNKDLLKYNPEQKIRIRFSLMPESKRKIHEPETSTILERIQAIEKFKDAGYEVYLSFSPIIVYDGWLDDYEELFALINNNVLNEKGIYAECIFLTHNTEKHYENLLKNPELEEDLWKEEMQEKELSLHGSQDIKYQDKLKNKFVEAFIKEHNNVIPWNRIKYIY